MAETLVSITLRNSLFSPTYSQGIAIFTGLEKLNQLNLYNNNLMTLPNVSAILPNLNTLNLRTNQWNCTCDIAWMWEIKSSKINDWSSIKCSYPSELAGKFFKDLDLYADCNRGRFLEMAYDDSLFYILLSSSISNELT